MGKSKRLRRSAAVGLAALIACVAVCLSLQHTPLILAAGQAKNDSTSQPPLDHPDRQCRTCHEAIYDSYQRTPMARGSGDAVEQLQTSSPAEHGFTHAPSGISYSISVRNGRAFLSYQRESGHPPLQGERQLIYFVGSSRRGRTYLYQQDHLWFEAPINWYGKKEVWDMAPAFERSTVMPAPLPVDANCLHCHAGEVQTATGGARNRFPGSPFRAPGVGCAACHGDPSAHLASAGKSSIARAQTPGAILNPARLDPVRRVDVCLQCHLEGDATVYLPGKSLASFQPGELLFKDAIYFVDSTRAQQGGRATSQYEALLRSACKRGAGDRLTCTTCHDPHSSPAPEERVAFFRAKCLTCHTGTSMATEHHPEQQDCAACHMPTRKTLDISHEQLTDHDIEARPSASAAVESRLVTPDLIPVGAVDAGVRERGLAYGQLAQHGNRGAGELAIRLLEQAERTGSDDYELHKQLGYLRQVSGETEAARQEYQAALRERPQDATAAANLAVLDAEQGRSGDALRLLRQTFLEDPSQTGAALNLAFLECRLGQKSAALAVVKRALTFNPDSPQGRTFLATGAYNGQTCALQ